MVMCSLAKVPWPATVGLGLLGARAIIGARASGQQRQRVWTMVEVAAWMCTLVVPARLLLQKDEGFSLDGFLNLYFAALAWLIATVVLPLTHRTGGTAFGVAWKKPALICALLVGLYWLASAYAENLRRAFYLGLLLNVSLLLLSQLWFRFPALGVVLANTLTLFLAGLPVADLFVPAAVDLDPHLVAAGQRYYSYEAGKKDPLAFTLWWNFFVGQWNTMTKDIFARDRLGKPGYYLRPNSHGQLFDSHISINSRGFRGREIPDAKGQAYRIACLGESTTFGCTLKAEDKPWPEVLEQIIRDRLKPRRPVEVINAGVPGYTLEDNLQRLVRDVLPLKPDLLISYHGYNGFHLLDATLPPATGPAPSVYQPRPLKLLADVEYRIRMNIFRRAQTSADARTGPRAEDVLRTPCAEAYRQLFQIARTNGIRLAVGNFSMAVNGQSPPDVQEFYRAGFPFVHRQIKANVSHSMMLRQMAEQAPEVCLVDTQPQLDGAHEKFIDLVHFTQAGRQQLAETFFAGIRKLLEADLSGAGAARAGP